MKLELPWPPTANTYYRRRRGRKGMFISAKGEQFAAAVAKEVSRRRARRKPLAGRLGVRILACPPDARARDIDNLLKPTLDALTKAGVWEDDSQIDDLQIVRGEITRPRGMCVVVVREGREV